MPSSTISPKSQPFPSGVFCPVISLYKPDARQTLDPDATYKYFSYLIRGGVDGLVLQGTTAEAVLLSPEERMQNIQIARKAALDLGIEKFPLVAGISGQSVNETVRLADDAKAAGADFGLLLPPSYWAKAVTKEVILGFYREVADGSGIPIVIYNFPGVTAGIDLNSDVISALAQHPNIVGVKLTCGNCGKVTRLSEEYAPDQFSVFAGQSDWLIPCLIGGGSGCVTGVGNIFPKSVANLYSLWKSGKVDEAVRFQGLVAQGEKACKEGLAALKFGASFFAGPAAGVKDPAAFYPRKPYLPAGKDLQSWTIEVMSQLGEIEKSLPDACPPPQGPSASNGADGIH